MRLFVPADGRTGGRADKRTDGRTGQSARPRPAAVARGPVRPPRRPPPPISRGRSSRAHRQGRQPAHRAGAPASRTGSGSGRRQRREGELLSAARCCRCASPPARWRPRRFPRCRRSSRASSTICEPRRSWTSASRWWRTTVSEAAAAPPRLAPSRGPARPGPSRPTPPPLPATGAATAPGHQSLHRAERAPRSVRLACRVAPSARRMDGEVGAGGSPTSWGGPGCSRSSLPAASAASPDPSFTCSIFAELRPSAVVGRMPAP